MSVSQTPPWILSLSWQFALVWDLGPCPWLILSRTLVMPFGPWFSISLFSGSSDCAHSCPQLGPWALADFPNTDLHDRNGCVTHISLLRNTCWSAVVNMVSRPSNYQPHQGLPQSNGHLSHSHTLPWGSTPPIMAQWWTLSRATLVPELPAHWPGHCQACLTIQLLPVPNPASTSFTDNYTSPINILYPQTPSQYLLLKNPTGNNIQYF